LKRLFCVSDLLVKMTAVRFTKHFIAYLRRMTMRLRYRTIKEPPVSGRVTISQVEQAVRALQQQEALKSSKSKLQKRSRNTGIARKTAAKGTRAGKKA
jgi:hypothetical protein